MNYSLDIDHGFKIIKYKHKGSLSYEDIGEAWNALLKLREFTELKYNLFSNYKDARFDMELDEIDRIVDFLFQLKPILEGKKQAIILMDPYSTAATMLFRNDVYMKVGFIVEIFTTEKAALHWLIS